MRSVRWAVVASRFRAIRVSSVCQSSQRAEPKACRSQPTSQHPPVPTLGLGPADEERHLDPRRPPDRAIEACKEAFELDPNLDWPYEYIAEI